MVLALVAVASMMLGACIEAKRMKIKSQLQEGFLSNIEYEKNAVYQRC